MNIVTRTMDCANCGETFTRKLVKLSYHDYMHAEHTGEAVGDPDWCVCDACIEEHYAENEEVIEE